LISIQDYNTVLYKKFKFKQYQSRFGGMSMFRKSILAVSALLVLPVFTMAQGSNDGATVVATFLPVPPTVDGTVAAGEWDAAGVAPGAWSDHGSATGADAAFPTTVKVAYSIDGLYILFSCVDDEVIAGAGGSEHLGSGPTGAPGQQQPFTFGGATDYLAIYLDPLNYANDAPNSNFYSYSIQAEPGVTWDNADSSYTYTELGQFGGHAAKLNPPIVNADGNLQYWAGGVSWDAPGMVVKDGPTADGYVMEFFMPWDMFSGYTTNFASEVLDGISDINLDNTDAPYAVQNALSHAFRFDADNKAYSVGSGVVTGMPKAGSQWKIQFCRYSETAVPAYSNWVGDTGGFASKPFGTIEFGGLPDDGGTSIREAFIHAN
jgi:hypothetical protein